MERDIIPMCMDEKMGICPYAVLGQGRFQTADKYQERKENGEGRKSGIPITDHDKRVAAVLEKIAEAKGGSTTLHHIAAAYAWHKSPYMFPLLGARKLEHLETSIEALSVSLTDEEIHEIEAAYPYNAGFPHTFLGGGIFQGSGVPANGVSDPSEVFLTKVVCGTVDFVEGPKPIKFS